MDESDNQGELNIIIGPPGIQRGAARARETYHEVADNARRGYDRVRLESGGLSRETDFYIRDNPGKALLIAAGVGFLLGLLTRGRGGRKK